LIVIVVSTNKKNDWKSVLDLATTYQEFMDMCKENQPRDFVLNHEKLEYFAMKHFAKAKEPYVPAFTEFRIHPIVQTWLDNQFNSDARRKKSLILIGASKLGKTEWARSLGPHMYFNGYANFKDDWDDSARYIIFDDFEWEFIPNKKGFFGGQLEFQISGKYMRTKSIKWGKCCIYLTNKYPNISNEDVDWYKENCIFLEVKNKMY